MEAHGCGRGERRVCNKAPIRLLLLFCIFYSCYICTYDFLLFIIYIRKTSVVHGLRKKAQETFSWGEGIATEVRQPNASLAVCIVWAAQLGAATAGKTDSFCAPRDVVTVVCAVQYWLWDLDASKAKQKALLAVWDFKRSGEFGLRGTVPPSLCRASCRVPCAVCRVTCRRWRWD